MAVSDSVYQKFFAAIDSHQEDYIKRLSEAVAIPSVSGDPARFEDCNRMSKWVQSIWDRLGAKTELCYPTGPKGERVPPILFGQLGSDRSKKTLLIYGHLDVQPASKDDGWNTDPFVLTEKDGKFFGRGSSDDKGPCISWINVVECLQAIQVPLPVNLKFCFECKEESGSTGLDEELAKRKSTFLKDVDFTCISDNTWLGPNKPCLTYGLRGICYFMIEIVSADKNLDSVQFGGVMNEAMSDLMWVMSQLTDPTGSVLIPGLDKMVAPLTDQEKQLYSAIDFPADQYQQTAGSYGLTIQGKENILMRKWRYPSLSLHGMEGGHSEKGTKHVIPGKVIGKFSIRLVPDMEPSAVVRLAKEHIEKTLWAKRNSRNSIKVTSSHGAKAWLGNYKDDNYQAGARATKRVYGADPDFTREGGSIPVTLTFQELTGKSVMLLPFGASDDMAHSQNEKLNRTNYINGMKLLGSYLLELATAK